MSESTRAPEPRARLRLANVRQAFAATPWAILPAKLDAMLAVVETHAAGGTLPKVENTFAARREAASGRRGTNGGVAVLPIYGVLTQRAGLMTDYSGGTSTEALTQAFDAMAADPNVGTIVLDIDSPGGSVAGIPELGAKIAAARESKKVIAVANTLCASAAYWLASQAHEIVASPSAMVGSIGVYAVHTDTSAADAQAGVSHTVIRFGAHKADGLVGPLSEDGIAEMQAIVDEHGKAFVAAVAKGRGITPAQVRADYGDGAIFAAKGAKAAGLVDRIASLEDVLGSLGATVRRREATYGANAEAAPVDLAAAIETELAAQLAQPDALRAAVIAALAPSADACVGALGDAPTTHTEPAPQARSHTVSDQNTAVQSGAAPTMAELLAADRKRVADVLAMATEYNVPAATANQWAADGLTVNEVAAKILEQRRTQSAAQPQITMGADRAAEKPFPTIAHQLFAVVQSAKNGTPDPRLLHINAAAQGSSTSSSADGGFLIQQDLASGIARNVWDQGQILADVTRTPVSGNGLKENVLKENSRANGSRNGGIQGYWGPEAGTITASKPQLRQVETSLNKVFAAWYATDEFLDDAPAMSSEVNQLVPEELTFQLEDKIWSGSGAGVPLGVMNSSALITQAIEATQTIANSAQFFPLNFVNMYNRMPARRILRAKWYVNQEVMAKVMTMTLGAGSAAIPVWLPANGLAGAPFGTILGRPVIPTEYAAAQGTVGDILFADFSDYRVIDKGGVQSASSIHVQFLTDETCFRWTYRVGGQPRTNSAITPYKGTATLSPYVALAARS